MGLPGRECKYCKRSSSIRELGHLIEKVTVVKNIPERKVYLIWLYHWRTLLITHPPWSHPVNTNFPFHHVSSLVYISLWEFPYVYHVLTPWFVNSLLVTLPSAGTYIEMDTLHVLWSDTSAPHIACPAWWWRVYPEIETQDSPQKKSHRSK